MERVDGNKNAWRIILISNFISLAFSTGTIICSILIWKEQNLLREFCLLLILLGSVIICNIIVIIFIARVNPQAVYFSFYVQMVLASIVLLLGIFISTGQDRFDDYLKKELSLSYTKSKEISNLISDYSLAARITSFLTVVFMVSYLKLSYRL